jgi:hypothetical protein
MIVAANGVCAQTERRIDLHPNNNQVDYRYAQAPALDSVAVDFDIACTRTPTVRLSG